MLRAEAFKGKKKTIPRARRRENSFLTIYYIYYNTKWRFLLIGEVLLGDFGLFKAGGGSANVASLSRAGEGGIDELALGRTVKGGESDGLNF